MLAAVWITGCSEPSPARRMETLPPEVIVDGRPVALVDGIGAAWEDLRPALLEAAGGEVLAEWILQRKIEAALLESDRRLGPAGIEAEWAGETYLNLVWQDEMVSGMLEAFLE